MKANKNNGFVAVDMIISIIAITIFSIGIVSLMHNNVIENVKLKKETLAMIYITEIFENVGIEDYDKITPENINNLIPQYVQDNYQVEMNITTDLTGVTDNENIMKKVTIKMSYEVSGKTYSCSMERMKIKE